VLIIAGDAPQEVLGKEERDATRLHVEGVPATLRFLSRYFEAGRSVSGALAAIAREPAPFVSLNGAYLRQFLDERGFSVALLPPLTPDRSELASALKDAPRAVVISTTFLPFAHQIDAIAAFVKEHSPNSMVIAGGVQVWKSWRHRQLLEAGAIAEDIRAAVARHNYLMDEARPSPVDALVVNPRGEETLVRLLSCMCLPPGHVNLKGTSRCGPDAPEGFGADWRSLDNVARFDGGRWRVNRITEEPDREIAVDWRRYPGDPLRTYYPVQAGIGCAFRCAFCDFCGLFPKVRLRDVGSVLREIETIPLVDGVRRVYFTDDSLFPNRERASALCEGLARSGLAVKWRGMVNASVVDDRTADLMARSGCMEVLLGVESGDAGMLERMRKRITPDEVLDAVGRLHRRGINTKSMFIIGFPGETDRTVRNTVDLLNAYPTDGGGVHRYMFFQFAVLPLAEVAKPSSRAKYALSGYGYRWRHSTMDSEEAARQIVAAQETVKPEISPSYPLEVPEMPGMSMEGIRRVFLLRNILVRTRDETARRQLWAELEACFVPRQERRG
jgi:anaerobic magnesium-protoporphyrin IX monomethyl ester cyclase